MENYGPLAALIGTWEGGNGMDVAPESQGIESNPYYETIVFEAGGDVTNAEKQKLMIVPYIQIVRRKSNDEVFHHQTGYWLWDPATGVVMQSLSIPRGLTLLAGGEANETDGTVTLSVKSAVDDPDWGIVQSPFMRENAKTTSFVHTISVTGDEMRYSETTMLEIYGSEFPHTDDNQLVRVS